MVIGDSTSSRFPRWWFLKAWWHIDLHPTPSQKRSIQMILGILLNAVVLGVTVLLVSKGEKKPDVTILLALPLGLGLLSSLLFFYFGWVSIVVSLAIAIFALRWAFDLTTNQSLITTGVWGVWQVVYSLI